MKTFKEYFASEDTMTDISVAIGKITGRRAYKKAAEILQKVWDRKKGSTNKSIEYYADRIARQFVNKLDPKTLAGMISEGPGKSEKWEDGFKRRVVKTTKPEHLEKGYKWRIKGKDRDEISIKLYKKKPDFAEFKKQMRRVAGHEFGG